METIQGVWVGSRLTTMERLSIKSYLQNGHSYHLYVYSDVDGVPEGTVVKDANDIVREDDIKRFWCLANFSDFFRVSMLLKYGGWYSDLDNICLKHYDFTSEYVFAASVIDKIVQTNVMKVPAHSQLMHYWLAHILNTDTLKMKFQDIGPDLLGKLIPQFRLQKYVQPRETFDPVRFDYAGDLVNPDVVWDLSKSYSVHCFHQAWLGETQHDAPQAKKSGYVNLVGTDVHYPRGCLYERLKARYQ